MVATIVPVWYSICRLDVELWEERDRGQLVAEATQGDRGQRGQC